MSEQSKEQRRNGRLTFSSRLAVQKGDQLVIAEARDLSATGMSFRTRQRLAIGDDVRIHIEKVVEQSSIAARVRHVAVEESYYYVVGVEHA